MMYDMIYDMLIDLSGAGGGRLGGTGPGGLRGLDRRGVGATAVRFIELAYPRSLELTHRFRILNYLI